MNHMAQKFEISLFFMGISPMEFRPNTTKPFFQTLQIPGGILEDEAKSPFSIGQSLITGWWFGCHQFLIFPYVCIYIYILGC